MGSYPKLITFKITITMSYFYDKTPALGAGLARSVMRFILTQVKSRRGLTTYMEHRGVNGRWLKPEDPYNIRLTKLLKIMEIKAHYQSDDEFLDDWKETGEFILHMVRTSDIIFFP